MNCQEALSLLYEIIDKEASQINVVEVQAHLKECSYCLEAYRLEGSVHKLICEKMKSESVTPRLKAVQSKLLAQLDQIDAESSSSRSGAAAQSSQKTSRPFAKTALTLALAASVVLAVGYLLVGRKLYDHHEIFMPLERAHWSASESVQHVTPASATVSEAISLSNSVNYPLNSIVDGFALINGRLEDIMGIQMGHFVYELGNKVISVFVAPADAFTIPDELKNSPVTRDGVQFYDHNCRGCHLVYHREQGVVIVTATTERDIDLMGFVPGKGTI